MSYSFLKIDREILPVAKQPAAWKAWTALVAAYVLVMQLLAVGLAAGAQVAVQGPETSGIICSSSQGQNVPGTDGGGSSHHDGLGCYVLGCPMFGPVAAPPPSFNGVMAPLPHSAAGPAMHGEACGASAHRNAHFLHTRFPPRAT